MFQEWNFLLAEIWVLLVLAALVGLIAGWLIWGGRADSGADADEVRRLRAELDREKTRNRSLISDPLDDIPPMQGGGYVRPDPTSPESASLPTFADQTPAPAAAQIAPNPAARPNVPQHPETSPEPTNNTKPQGMDTARDGLPDELTKIKGIGPKMEKLCNSLGFWHFDQIAEWNADEVAWVDDNLEGFKGRVTRDDWVAQAKNLALNQTPAFVRRKD